MATYTVKIMTDSGEIDYPDYQPESGNFTDAGNSKDILFTPYNGQETATVTSVILDDGSGSPVTLPASFMVAFGDVVKFPAGTLSITSVAATPVITGGAPYAALVSMRLALMQLVNDNPQYALQKIPESGEPFTALHIVSSRRESNPFHKTWDSDRRVYYYNCQARILVIRSSDDAQSFLENFMYRVDSTAGEYWQYENNCVIYRSGEFENASPLIDKLVYQQMAQVELTLRFIYRHYEQEKWLTGATVNDDNTVTVKNSGT